MSKGGARLGAGRKPKEEVLKGANFRLSMEDLKVLNKNTTFRSNSHLFHDPGVYLPQHCTISHLVFYAE